MQLLSALLLGISTNLDNLLLGLSLGIGQKKIPSASNWVIGLFSAAATCLFCCISSLCTALGPAADIAGSAVILLMGFLSLRPPRENAGGQDCCSWSDTAILGAALAVNGIPVAFGAGLTGIHPLAASASVGFLSVLSIRLGNWLGLHAAALPVRPAALQRLGGLMMVGLGLLQLCT